MDRNVDDLLDELVKSSKRVYVSEDEEEPFILMDRGSEGLVFIAPGADEDFTVIEIPLSRIASMEMVFQDALESYIGRDAILTVGCGNSADSFYINSWDIRRRGRRLYYGYNRSHYLFLVSRVYWCLENWGYASLILKSFTDKIDRKTGLPIKQVRGFLLAMQGESLKLENVPLKDLIEAENRDPKTGETLPPEPSVEYCYENSCISSDNM